MHLSTETAASKFLRLWWWAELRMVSTRSSHASFPVLGARKVLRLRNQLPQLQQERFGLTIRRADRARNIQVNFVEGRALAAQAMALDHRTMLGPPLRIQSAATLRGFLA